MRAALRAAALATMPVARAPCEARRLAALRLRAAPSSAARWCARRRRCRRACPPRRARSLTLALARAWAARAPFPTLPRRAATVRSRQSRHSRRACATARRTGTSSPSSRSGCASLVPVAAKSSLSSWLQHARLRSSRRRTCQTTRRRWARVSGLRTSRSAASTRRTRTRKWPLPRPRWLNLRRALLAARRLVQARLWMQALASAASAPLSARSSDATPRSTPFGTLSSATRTTLAAAAAATPTARGWQRLMRRQWQRRRQRQRRQRQKQTRTLLLRPRPRGAARSPLLRARLRSRPRGRAPRTCGPRCWGGMRARFCSTASVRRCRRARRQRRRRQQRRTPPRQVAAVARRHGHALRRARSRCGTARRARCCAARTEHHSHAINPRPYPLPLSAAVRAGAARAQPSRPAVVVRAAADALRGGN